VHGFAGRCLTTRPLHHWGLMPLHPRADDGIRTRDPHLGKVMRYQLRYIRAPRTTSSPVAKDDDSPPKCSRTNLSDPRSWRAQNGRYASWEIEKPWPVWISRHVVHDSALSHRSTPAVIDSPYGSASSAPKGGVAGADKLRLPARRERDALPVVELADPGPRWWRPVAVDDVAAGPGPGRSSNGQCRIA
jgi:hypothetical protein